MGSKNNTHFSYSPHLIAEDPILVQPNKALSHGKDMGTLRLECERNFEKFLDECINKVDEHHPAGSSINASITCMHLSRVENPLRKSNNDKGKQQLVNHARALSIIDEDTINKYVNDRFYIVDLIHRDRNESYIKKWGIMNDYEIGLTQTLMPLHLIVKLDQYLNQNQRFKKDKSGQQIIRNIIPPEENVDIWITGWTAEINIREFAYQLAIALYHKLDGDNYHQCHRNH